MKIITRILLLALVCLVPVSGQTTSSGNPKDTGRKQHETAAIFDEIMQTLPSDMKAKVDSASVCARSEAKKQDKGSSVTSSGSQKQASQPADRDDAVRQLPDDVRAKVEKAISDIDLMNQDRQIQFKDYEKKRPGSK
ncbi:MAG TPA: hypothetical protein VKF42_02315 [Chitinivibrionales bacterium]|jgi:hypothetical protein|nr:hypothetical protein [Chitinivibrionales bacterium]